VHFIDLIESGRRDKGAKPKILISEIGNESLDKDFQSNSQTGVYDQTEYEMSASKKLSTQIHSISSEYF